MAEDSVFEIGHLLSAQERG